MPAIVTGLSGCLLLATMPTGAESGLAMIPAAGNDYYYGMPGVAAPLVIGPPLAAIVLALMTLRRWPLQLVVAALLSVPQVLIGWDVLPRELGLVLYLTGPVTRAFALIGVLACAQSLWRGGAHRWGTAMAGLALGARLFDTALIGRGSSLGRQQLVLLWLGMTAVALFALLAFAWRVQWADRENADPRSDRPLWARARTAVLAGVALFAIIPLSQVSRSDLAGLLGIASGELAGHRHLMAAVAGAVTLVLAAAVAAVAGPWSLGGALTMTVAQAALAVPLALVYFALEHDAAARCAGLLAGVALGLAATATRWPVAATGVLGVTAATSLFVADLATGGAPDRIGTGHRTVPAVLILVLVVAAVTAVAAAVTPAVAARRSLPAVYGPLAGLMASGLVQVLDVTYLEADDYLDPTKHLATTGLLLLVAAGAVGGLGLARHLSERWARRRQAEQIRREAAEAERDRLAGPMHDGVLQVLALVQRGEVDPRLAELAGEQDVALRKLLRDDELRDDETHGH